MFYGCGNLKNVLIPNSVETVNNFAFCDCKSINSIYLPKNLKYISGSAFTLKDTLVTIKASDQSKNYTSINNAAEVSVDSVTHYQSSYIRKHATIYPDLNTLKCNNISTTKARGAGYSDSCQVFK